MKPTLSWFERRARDARALAHYRPRQVARRLLLQLRRRATSLAPGMLRQELAAIAASPPGARDRGPGEAFLEYALDPSVTPPAALHDLLEGRFRFLGESRVLGAQPAWNDRRPDGPSHLWRMNLHYHRFVVDAAAAVVRGTEGSAAMARAEALLDDWSASCPPGTPGGWTDAWNSYAVATRVLHAWTAWLLLGATRGEAASRFRRRLESSGASGATFLERWLERDLGGNHLLRNAAALTAAGRWFSGRDADRWRATGGRLLAAELSAQLLADGFHEERSPMYHALALEELLVAAFAPAGDPDATEGALGDQAARMVSALRGVLHPDGEIALLNDSAFGIAAPPPVLVRFAASLGIRRSESRADLPDAGYFRFAAGDDVLIFDAGPVGPNHLPAHAHCDVLSFEWSSGGDRIVTDTGVDRYAAGPERDFQRSTAAHATLQVEDLEQAECFSSFRVGRRPAVTGRRTGPAAAEGSHDGFGAATPHRRVIEWREGLGFAWTDALPGARPRDVTVRVPLAPGIRAKILSGEAILEAPGARGFRLRAPVSGGLSVERGRYCPRFGEAIDREVVRWDGRLGGDQLARFEIGPR